MHPAGDLGRDEFFLELIEVQTQVVGDPDDLAPPESVKPANSGVANRKSMIVPCVVKSWFVTDCSPGRANARITSASMPPIRKKGH
ncbi:hypothetical protein ACIBP6_03695 [Nonomuraea terrae]|uniref:hypothetical protein n=1 Tax=Nonomuraea terrae TaxID=2530383 RepID=UPI0037B18AC2